jgi:AraC-like DNA-binding protein
MHHQARNQSFVCTPALADVCQCIIGESAMWPAWPELDSLAARFDQISGPASYPDAVMAAGILTQFTYSLAERIHERLHEPDGLPSCSFNPEAHTAGARIDCEHPEAWSPSAAVGDWARRYITALTSSHDVLVGRAKQRLARDLEQRLLMGQLARELACSVPVLHRRFVSQAGETPIRYQARLRAIEAVRLIHTTNWKIDAVGRAVGWKSRKDLYRALAQFAGVSPRTIRGLSRADAALLQARMADPSTFQCLPLPSPQIAATPSSSTCFAFPKVSVSLASGL